MSSCTWTATSSAVMRPLPMRAAPGLAIKLQASTSAMHQVATERWMAPSTMCASTTACSIRAKSGRSNARGSDKRQHAVAVGGRVLFGLTSPAKLPPNVFLARVFDHVHYIGRIGDAFFPREHAGELALGLQMPRLEQRPDLARILR